ncbi:uncharacterized protein LOC111398292 [Olea europaea var. sylvestris]|uniref:uncharacterized protein LOC111398292 n=1 Tax=Olea europaea var. sylvestris TaxID=158386 RepID=UPI000C1D413A|nr:uncharacterized protein LOC111398292 [Olea europaea var. sylvestris]
MENNHLAQELLRQYNRKRVAPRCLLKIDLSKAYDSVCWDFLRDVLVGLKFPSRFVHWIMKCVTSISYSIALNGTLHGFFKGEKGLRQGDPLSPFLFVLCIEYLSRLLKDATYESDFNFHPKCGPQKINHLAFADDLMLFARGDFLSVKILMDCLSKFGSGNNVISVFGHPLASDKLKVSGYAPFLDKITSYIGAWNSSILSYAGKMELIREFLQGVECFLLSIFPIPATIISRIDSLWIRWVNHVYLHGSCIWEVRPRKDHSPLFKKLLEIRDIISVNAAAQQIFIHGQQGRMGLMDAGSVSSRQVLQGRVYSAGNGRNARSLSAGNTINSPVHGQFLDSNTCRQTASFGRQFLVIWSENLGCSTAAKFSTKNAYNFFRPKGTFKPWGAEVWKACITPKHSFMLWLGAQSKLLTKDKLLYLDIDCKCVLCGCFDETFPPGMPGGVVYVYGH